MGVERMGLTPRSGMFGQRDVQIVGGKCASNGGSSVGVVSLCRCSGWRAGTLDQGSGGPAHPPKKLKNRVRAPDVIDDPVLV